MTGAVEADALIAEADALPRRDVPSLRALRRERSRVWRNRPADFMRGVAEALVARGRYQWIGHELVRHHRPAFRSLDDAAVRRLMLGLDTWAGIDAFGRILAGPAWAAGLVSDALVNSWSRARDRWRRRLALVATIELADTARSLALCARLTDDHDDMVEKALSWALRERAKRDPKAVAAFLAAHEERLGARVKREVRNKLGTGLKNPRKTR